MIRKGRGISTIYYPSGFNGGGDPDLVSLRMKPDGTIDISNASCEMGQGLKNVAVQIAAECLGIAPDKMYNVITVYGDTFYDMRGLDLATDYYFAIEALNESGVSVKSKILKQ